LINKSKNYIYFINLVHAAVDTNFITKTDREFMGIGESSIGGKYYNERTGEEIQKKYDSK
jgi:hypothetical protein